MEKARLILRLYTQGVSKRTITDKAGCSRNTVKRYIRQFIALGKTFEQLDKLSNTELEELFKQDDQPYNEKLEKLIEFFPEVEKALKRKGVTREMMWQQYIDANPDGYRLSQFKVYYNRWRKHVNCIMHIEHKAGDKMYVDYAGKKLSIVDLRTGEQKPVEVFVAILGASQLAYVEASLTQTTEDFIQSCENALHYFEGVPRAIVPDNLKAAVIKSNKYEPTLNEAFSDFALHYGIAALPAGPYKPRHKALAEGMVKIMYRTIYPEVKKKTYTSIEDINAAIHKAMEDEINNKLMKSRPYSRRGLFEDIERNELQPLPVNRFELKRKKVVTVAKNCYVCLSEDKHYYTVPYQYVGKKVKLFYSQTEVEIYYHYDRIASHKRSFELYGHTKQEEHLSPNHKYMSEWTPEQFLEKATAIGPQTKDYIQKVLDKPQHREQAYRSCKGILSLAKKVGNERLNNACERADYFQDYSYTTIITILERKLDIITNEDDPKEMPLHNNIRGQAYYN